MREQAQQTRRFRERHYGPTPLLLPNPWDPGSARLLASLGFEALATTSSGFAASRGRLDGSLARDTVLNHVADIVAATDLPVSADLENCYADTPEGVAETARAVVSTGAAGFSIEDYSGRADDPVYDASLAAERVSAAAEAAHTASAHLVITARAENHIRHGADLADTLQRLQAFREAGADVVYAPGLTHSDDIAAVVSAVDCPVNVLAIPGVPTVAELGRLGVARVSVGGAFTFAAYDMLARAGAEFFDHGTYEFREQAAAGQNAARKAFFG